MIRSAARLIVIILITHGVESFAEEFRSDTVVIAEAGYFHPNEDDRKINSFVTGVRAGKEYVNYLHYTLTGGVMGIRAKGNVTRWNESFQDERVDVDAWGLGPVVGVRGDFLRYGRLSLSGDFVFGMLFFNHSFPPGGTRHNFIRQFGLTAGVDITEHYRVSVCARQLHISNGKGMVPENPSYEGRGLIIEVASRM